MLAPRGELRREIAVTNFPINDDLQNRVLDSTIPLLFNVDMDLRRGIASSYLHFWRKMGVTTVVGIALRYADVNLGV
jgi:hypothetical protein